MNQGTSKTKINTMISRLRKNRLVVATVASLVGLLVLGGGYYGYLYASTPEHIRNPSYEHYHLRTQIIADGQAVDFSEDQFQVDYDASTCSAELSEQPIDFHDNEDQMTHIHWSGITGGELLKYYGWNFIGGEDDSLGRRYDQGMMRMPHADTYGDLLPDISQNSNFYIYVGDEFGYEQKEWNDFLNTDLEVFFGTKSFLNNEDVSGFNILGLFSARAYAHGGVDDGDEEISPNESDEERLTRINNLIGNVVIFSQEKEPTEEQVRERFENLVPLHDSTCGG